MKFEFCTGRDYGQPQVINVTILGPMKVDAFGIVEFEAEFLDNSRNINGRVSCIAFGQNEHEYVKAVLAEYDAGRYETI